MSDFESFVPQRRFQEVVAVSPDGSRVVYSTNDGGHYNLWLRPLAGGDARQLTSFTEQTVRAAAWAPDGASVAFAADVGGDEQYQLYLLDVPADDGPDREPQRITSVEGRQHTLADSPFDAEGTMLVYGANDRDESIQDVLLHDLASGEVRRVESVLGAMAFPMGISPDGRWLLVEVAMSNTDRDCALVDLTDDALTLRVITAHEGDGQFIPGDWLADSSGFLIRTDAGREFTWLGRCDLDGAITPLATPDWDIDAVHAAKDGTIIVWIANESGASVPYVHRGDPKDARASFERAEQLPTGTCVLYSTRLTPDGATLVALVGTGVRPRDLATFDLETGVVAYLTDSRPAALLDFSAVAPELVEFPTHDGRSIPAWLYRPAGEGPHPVVLSIHGGPEAQEKAEYNSGLYQCLLSHGVGVLAPNVRGSTGYGGTYQKLIHRDWGGAELGDFEHAVAYLTTLDWVDDKRIAVFGGSFGGFAALSCLSRLPELFAAGVSIVGPSNLVTFAKAVPPTWRPLMAVWVGDPDTDVDFLMSRSPITYVDQIVAPLFVIQGANDPRVVQSESDQIVEALRRRGVEVRYDVYPDEGHGFTQRSNEIKAIGDVGGFLVGHLL